MIETLFRLCISTVISGLASLAFFYGWRAYFQKKDWTISQLSCSSSFASRVRGTCLNEKDFEWAHSKFTFAVSRVRGELLAVQGTGSDRSSERGCLSAIPFVTHLTASTDLGSRQ